MNTNPLITAKSGVRKLALLAGVSAVVVPYMAFAAPSPNTPDPAFQRVWARTDYPVQQGRAPRSWVWGPRPIATVNEQDVDSPGGTRQVQYYDKARMEVSNPTTDPASPWYVTNGLLVAEMISGRLQLGATRFEQREPARLPVAGDVANPGQAPTFASLSGVASLVSDEHRAQPRSGQAVMETLAADGTVGVLPTANGNLPKLIYYEQTTGHNIPDVFMSFMNLQGLVYENGAYQQGRVFDWVYTLGYPITEPYWININIQGRATRVMMQAFQRRILTFNPGNAPAWQVEMGNVGMQYYQWRYAQRLPVPTATPVAAPGGQALTTRHFTLAGTLAPRQYSSIHDPLYAVATDAQSWRLLWERHTAMFDASIPPPAVDFTKEFAVAAFWGDKPNSCYHLDIGAVTASGNKITVGVNTTVNQGACLSVITQPHDFAAVSRNGLARGPFKVDFVDGSGKTLSEVDTNLP